MLVIVLRTLFTFFTSSSQPPKGSRVVGFFFMCACGAADIRQCPLVEAPGVRLLVVHMGSFSFPILQWVATAITFLYCSMNTLSASNICTQLTQSLLHMWSHLILSGTQWNKKGRYSIKWILDEEMEAQIFLNSSRYVFFILPSTTVILNLDSSSSVKSTVIFVYQLIGRQILSIIDCALLHPTWYQAHHRHLKNAVTWLVRFYT